MHAKIRDQEEDIKELRARLDALATPQWVSLEVNELSGSSDVFLRAVAAQPAGWNEPLVS